eukprot:3722365-Prymnesium_polylepis.1
MQGLAHREGGVRPGGRPPCPGVIPLHSALQVPTRGTHIHTRQRSGRARGSKGATGPWLAHEIAASTCVAAQHAARCCTASLARTKAQSRWFSLGATRPHNMPSARTAEAASVPPLWHARRLRCDDALRASLHASSLVKASARESRA